MKSFLEHITEDFNLAMQQPTSNAAAEAKALGLQYVGFGRYEDPNTNQITHIVQNEKLVPFSKAVKSNTYKAKSTDDFGNLTMIHQPQTDEIRQLLTARYDPSKYTGEELDAIKAYTGGDYVDISKALSQLPAGYPSNQIEPDSDVDTKPATIKALDSALNRVSTPFPFVAYQAVSPDLAQNLFPKDSVMQFKTFRSLTTNLQNVTSQFPSQPAASPQKRASRVVFQINIDKGQKGMFLENFTAVPGEDEFLLPRGSFMTVLGGPTKLVGSNLADGVDQEVYYYDCKMG